MNINPILNNNISMLHQVVNTKLLKKSLDMQKGEMQQILKMMHDSGIGKNIDITV